MNIAGYMDAQIIAGEGSGRAWRAGHIVLVAAVLASWLVLSGLNLWMGELNQDEGWYLYAAKQMTEGQMPYRDFAYTQAPMLPLVYSWAYGWVERFGLLGGRAVTWFFGALGLLSSVWLAMRAGPRNAQRLTAGLCFILVATNVYQSYFTTVVKTYALASMFLCSGLAMLSFVGPKKGFRSAMGAGFLLACAAATRISLGAALALGGFYLLICRRRLKSWAWLDYGIGGLLGLAIPLVFAALGRDGFRFGVMEYHSMREAGPVLIATGLQSRLPVAAGPGLFPGGGGRARSCSSWPAAICPAGAPRSTESCRRSSIKARMTSRLASTRSSGFRWGCWRWSIWRPRFPTTTTRCRSIRCFARRWPRPACAGGCARRGGGSAIARPRLAAPGGWPS